MVFQRKSSATMGHSLPHTSSGNSVRLMLSFKFCHHRTIPNQMDGSNALLTPSATSSNWEGRDIWIKSWIHSCWLTGWHPAPLFNNNVVLLNCSSDVSSGQHWIFFFWPSNQRVSCQPNAPEIHKTDRRWLHSICRHFQPDCSIPASCQWRNWTLECTCSGPQLTEQSGNSSCRQSQTGAVKQSIVGTPPF